MSSMLAVTFEKMLQESRKELEQMRRSVSVVRFGTDVVGDAQGNKSYKLCAAGQRHYTVKILGKGHQIVPQFVPCDNSCQGGKEVNVTLELLVLLGMRVRVPNGNILVLVEEATARNYWTHSYKVHAAGEIVEEALLQEGKLLQNGESLELKRTLNHTERIDLTPVSVRVSKVAAFRNQNEKVVTQITDFVYNIGGKAEILNDETELRAKAEQLAKEYYEIINRQSELRNAAKKEFAREVSRYLQNECGFTRGQVGKLFELAGAGQCRRAVEEARELLARKKRAAERPSDRPERFDDFHYDEDIDAMTAVYHVGHPYRDRWQRIVAGAEYIVSIGGVPKDK